jgi:hypothetical protein
MLMSEIMPLPGGKNISGTVLIVAVSKDSIPVGQGFMIWDWLTERQCSPIISSFNGKPLPIGEYDIQVVEEHLALISFNVH